MACKPLEFNGSEGVIGLTQWLEKTESIFRISACPNECQVTYAACTLIGSALSWWNDHARSMGVEAAHALDWGAFKQLMIKAYCSRPEIQALEQELWNHKMKGAEVITYTSRFIDLANLCPRMVSPEPIKIERYIWGLAQPVQSLVTAAQPTTFDSAKQLAYQLTEQCNRPGSMIRQNEKNPEGGSNKRSEEGSRENLKRIKPNPEPATTHAAIAPAPVQVKPYGGKAPYCAKCDFHHSGICLFCDKCKRKGHSAQNCRKPIVPTPATGANRTCYQCDQPGHFRKDCPQLGQGGRARAFVIGVRHDNPDGGLI